MRAACGGGRLQLRAQQLVHFLRLLRAWRSGRCRWPTPVRRPRPSREAQCASVWITTDSWRLTTAAVSPASRCASVSPTQTIGVTPERQRGLGLVGDQLVALSMQRAALGMADDHVAAAELGQHRRPRPRRCRRPACAPNSPARPSAMLAAGQRDRRLATGTGTARTPPRRTRRAAPRRCRPATRHWPDGCRASSSCRRSACAVSLMLRLQSSTILPTCTLDSISACACAACAAGNTL